MPPWRQRIRFLTDLGSQLPSCAWERCCRSARPADLLQLISLVYAATPIGPACGRRSKGRTTLIASVAGAAPGSWSATHCHPTPEFDMKVISPAAPTFATYRRDMRAEQMAEVIRRKHRFRRAGCCPHARRASSAWMVPPGRQAVCGTPCLWVVRFIVPIYERSLLAGVLSRSTAGRCAERLSKRSATCCLTTWSRFPG